MNDLPLTNKEELTSLTPAEVLQMLRKGNDRYVSGEGFAHDHRRSRQLTATGQYPYAIVLSCIDSRVIPEAIFDTGIGELFVVRIAGNIVNRDILGSMEYACAVTGSKVVVVMGHTSCGAVKGAVDKVVLGNLTGALRPLQLAVTMADPQNHLEHTSSDKEFVDIVARKNVEITMEDIRGQSAVLREMEEQGRILIAGAMYDHVTGKVEWME
jgi:carbonic anhydrase